MDDLAKFHLFYKYVDKSGGPDACWSWIGGRNKDGRGRGVVFNGRRRPAPVLAWILEYGEEYWVEGSWACHTCDNPNCVNHTHVYQGNRQSNTEDIVTRNRLKNKA
jgi:hypothetical protein